MIERRRILIWDNKRLPVPLREIGRQPKLSFRLVAVELHRMDFNGKFAVELLVAALAEIDGAERQPCLAPHVHKRMPGGPMLASVDPVSEDAHWRIEPLRLAADCWNGGIRFELPVLPY